MSILRFIALSLLLSVASAADELTFDRMRLAYLSTGGFWSDINTNGVEFDFRTQMSEDIFVDAYVLRSTGEGWLDFDHDVRTEYDYDESRIGIGRLYQKSDRLQLFMAADFYHRDQPDIDECNGCLFADEYKGNDNEYGVAGHFGLFKRIGDSSFFHTGVLLYVGGRNEQHAYVKWEWPLYKMLAFGLGLSVAHDGVASGQLGLSSSF